MLEVVGSRSSPPSASMPLSPPPCEARLSAAQPLWQSPTRRPLYGPVQPQRVKVYNHLYNHRESKCTTAESQWTASVQPHIVNGQQVYNHRVSMDSKCTTTESQWTASVQPHRVNGQQVYNHRESMESKCTTTHRVKCITTTDEGAALYTHED